MQNTRGIPNPCGADGEIRTPDLPLTRRPLYQLSYTSGYVLLYAERTVFICPSRPEGRPGAMKGCSDTINPAPAEGSCPLCRHISPGSSPRRSSAREPIGLVVLSGSGLLRLPSGPSGGAQTHDPMVPNHVRYQLRYTRMFVGISAHDGQGEHYQRHCSQTQTQLSTHKCDLRDDRLVTQPLDSSPSRIGGVIFNGHFIPYCDVVNITLAQVLALKISSIRRVVDCQQECLPIVGVDADNSPLRLFGKQNWSQQYGGMTNDMKYAGPGHEPKGLHDKPSSLKRFVDSERTDP